MSDLGVMLYGGLAGCLAGALLVGLGRLVMDLIDGPIPDSLWVPTISNTAAPTTTELNADRP